jgi:hypothetical protein
MRAMTLFRSMTDIHPMGRQNEGIEGIDPARHGRVAAWEHVDSNGLNTSKSKGLLKLHLSFQINSLIGISPIWLVLCNVKS